MRRSTLIGGAALLVLIAVAVFTGPMGVAGASPAIVGTGHPTCAGAWLGAIEFSPALKTAGTAPKETIEIKAVAKPCASGVPVPTSGTVTALKSFVATNANRCSNVLPAATATTKTDAIPLTVKVGWTPTSIAATTIALPNLKVTSTLAASPLTFHSIGPAAGSYVNPVASLSIKSVKSFTTIWGIAAGNCGSASGLSILTIRAAGTTGTF